MTTTSAQAPTTSAPAPFYRTHGRRIVSVLLFVMAILVAATVVERVSHAGGDSAARDQ